MRKLIKQNLNLKMDLGIKFLKHKKNEQLVDKAKHLLGALKDDLGERELKAKLEAIGQEEILGRKVRLDGFRGIDRAGGDELRRDNQRLEGVVSG